MVTCMSPKQLKGLKRSNVGLVEVVGKIAFTATNNDGVCQVIIKDDEHSLLARLSPTATDLNKDALTPGSAVKLKHFKTKLSHPSFNPCTADFELYGDDSAVVLPITSSEHPAVHDAVGLLQTVPFAKLQPSTKCVVAGRLLSVTDHRSASRPHVKMAIADCSSDDGSQLQVELTVWSGYNEVMADYVNAKNDSFISVYAVNVSCRSSADGLLNLHANDDGGIAINPSNNFFNSFLGCNPDNICYRIRLPESRIATTAPVTGINNLSNRAIAVVIAEITEPDLDIKWQCPAFNNHVISEDKYCSTCGTAGLAKWTGTAQLKCPDTSDAVFVRFSSDCAAEIIGMLPQKADQSQNYSDTLSAAIDNKRYKAAVVGTSQWPILLHVTEMCAPCISTSNPVKRARFAM